MGARRKSRRSIRLVAIGGDQSGEWDRDTRLIPTTTPERSRLMGSVRQRGTGPEGPPLDKCFRSWDYVTG